MNKVLLLIVVILCISCKHSNKIEIKFKSDKSKGDIEYLIQAKKFIQEIGQNEFKDTSSFLADTPSTFKTLDGLNEFRSDTALFTKKEIDFVDAEGEKALIKKWTTTFFPKIVTQDTINAIFKPRSLSGWLYFHTHFGRRIINFSKPIFFRNYTYCLFYYGSSCGGTCGGGGLFLYKKEDDKWVEVKTYSSWVS